jgi:ADP-ribose pyrophosphatase YjhB (NUDIX family)
MLVSELAQRLRYLPEATAKGAKAESDDACDAADVGTNVGTDICTDVATGGNVDEVSVTERQRPTKWQAPEVQPARSWTFWFHHPDPELTPCLPGPLAKLPQEILTAERALRAAYFTSQDSPENRSAEQGADLSVCTDGTRNIYNSFQSDPLWQCCQQDYLAVQSFKAEWVSAPYTPIFHTVDALVRCTVKEPSDEAELSQTDYLLLIERGRAPGQGLWAIPGGFLEPDESRFVGALRELVEETGLAIAMSEAEACCVGHWVVDAPRRSARGRILTTLYVFDLGVRTELPPVMGADDAAKAEWVSLPSIKSGACFEDHFFLVSQAALRFGWPNTVLRSAS